MKSIEIQSIRETGLEKSRQNYEKAIETLVVIIKQISDLPIPEKTIQSWRTLVSSVRIVDDRLDHIITPEERLKFSENMISFLKGKKIDFSGDELLEKAMLDIRNMSKSLNETQRDLLVSLLQRILKVTEKIKNEENPRELVDLTRLEGQITGKLFLPFLPENFRLSENYQKLVHALTRLGRAANSFDTFNDLPSDYKNEQVKVKPNIFNRVLFLGAVLSDGLSLLRDTGISRDTIKEFLSRAKDTIKNYSEKR